MAATVLSAAIVLTSSSVLRNSMTRLVPSLQEAASWYSSLSTTVTALQQRNVTGKLKSLHALVTSDLVHGVQDEAIVIALDSLRATVQLMNLEMSKINDKLAAHKQKYLAGWRSIGYDAEVAQLAKLEPLLCEQAADLNQICGTCASLAILGARTHGATETKGQHAPVSQSLHNKPKVSLPQVVSCTIFEVGDGDQAEEEGRLLLLEDSNVL